MAENDEGPTIDIDVGMTYLYVGIWQHDRVEIIANDQGNWTAPSYVAFTDTERLIGSIILIRGQAWREPTPSFYDFSSCLKCLWGLFYGFWELEGLRPWWITMSAVREWAASQDTKVLEASCKISTVNEYAWQAVAVNKLGKWKTATQMTALTIMLASRDSSNCQRLIKLLT
ncbi:hypothetical protein Taro_037061 [Colocasia esculenta]|uniref:Uncharacterized protein n=1 Tax=Colocasia esculenta TaxID=4460 RepID=A0A843WJP1_COLES|nr:hypothetical protein [Colocasia esculenta]